MQVIFKNILYQSYNQNFFLSSETFAQCLLPRSESINYKFFLYFSNLNFVNFIQFHIFLCLKMFRKYNCARSWIYMFTTADLSLLCRGRYLSVLNHYPKTWFSWNKNVILRLKIDEWDAFEATFFTFEETIISIFIKGIFSIVDYRLFHLLFFFEKTTL